MIFPRRVYNKRFFTESIYDVTYKKMKKDGSR